MAENNLENSMTPAEIDALTPEQLRIEVAVQVMGWRWMKYPAPNMSDGTKLTGLYPPDAPGRWPCANHYYRIWEISDALAPRFSDWMEGVVWWDDDGAIHHRGLPDYPNDIASAWTVVDKFNADDDDGLFEELTNEIPLVGMTAQDAANAICLAALKAICVL